MPNTPVTTHIQPKPAEMMVTMRSVATSSLRRLSIRIETKSFASGEGAGAGAVGAGGGTGGGSGGHMQAGGHSCRHCRRRQAPLTSVSSMRSLTSSSRRSTASIWM